MIKCEGPEELPAKADLGVIMQYDGQMAKEYGACAAAHNTLVDYLNGMR